MVPAPDSATPRETPKASVTAQFLPQDHLQTRCAYPKSLEHVKLLGLCARAVEAIDKLIEKWSDTDFFTTWPERRVALYNGASNAIRGLRDYILINRRESIFNFDPELKTDCDRIVVKSQGCLQFLGKFQSIGDSNTYSNSATSNTNPAKLGELQGAIMLAIYDSTCAPS